MNDTTKTETLGPIWRAVQAVHVTAMRDNLTPDEYRAKMLAVLLPAQEHAEVREKLGAPRNRYFDNPFRDPLLGGPTLDEIPLSPYEFVDGIDVDNQDSSANSLSSAQPHDFERFLFDILEALKPHFPEIAGGFARMTGGVDTDYIVGVLRHKPNNGLRAALAIANRRLALCYQRADGRGINDAKETRDEILALITDSAA